MHAVLPDGLATVPGTRYHGYGLFVQAVAADLALGEGDLPTARAWLGAQNRWLDWSGAVMGQVDAALGWAGYHRAAGDLTRAREHADRAIVLAGEPRQPLMLIAAHRLLSELDTLDGRYAAALAHLRVALDLAEACAVPYERALCQLALAELREAERSVEAARGMLAEAQSILAKLGAKPALARAEAIATHLDAHPVAQAAAPTRPFGLSTREAEVLQLVAQGLSNVSIADRLSLSHRTIEQHLRSIYDKLGVENRAAATRIAVEQKHG